MPGFRFPFSCMHNQFSEIFLDTLWTHKHLWNFLKLSYMYLTPITFVLAV